MFINQTLTNNHNLLKLSLLGWIVYKFSSYNLWFSFDRDFPLVSPFNIYKLNYFIIQDIISGFSFLILIMLIIKLKKSLLILLLILEFILISSDMMRWQPPIFQFYAIVLIYTIKPKYFKYYLIVLLSATYFYSGLNKFNLRFINFIWAKSILIDFMGLSPDFAYSKLVKALGFILPIIELFAGLLILSKYRKVGFFTVVGIHVFILLYISPLGLNINSAVWSWNIIMIFYALAFLKQNTIDKPKFKIVEKSWVVLLYVLPILNLFEYYYPYFAFDLYSGSRYYLYVKTTSPDETDVSTLNIDNWSRKNLNVPFTHSHFLFKRFIKSYSKTYPNSNALFEISCYPFKTKEKYSG